MKNRISGLYKKAKSSGRFTFALPRGMVAICFILATFLISSFSAYKPLQKKAASQHSPISVIFETDMGNDIDDALALDMIYKYGTVYLTSKDPVKGWQELPVGKMVLMPGVSASEIYQDSGKYYMSYISHQKNGLHFFEITELIWNKDGSISLKPMKQ